MFLKDKNLKRATMRKTSWKTISFLSSTFILWQCTFFYYEIRKFHRLTSHILLQTCNGGWTPWKNARPISNKLFQIDWFELRWLYRTLSISLRGCKQHSRILCKILSKWVSHSTQMYVHPLDPTWDVCFSVSTLFSMSHWNRNIHYYYYVFKIMLHKSIYLLLLLIT